ILAKAAVKKFKNVGEKALINPFLQGWKVNLSAAGLPRNLKRMMKVGYKFHTRPVATGATKAVKNQMPIWHHTGAKPKLVSIYGDSWGVCQRETHNIMYVGEMVEHASRLNAAGCSMRKNCKCSNCKTDRAKGCENPTKCRRNAVKKLDNIQPEWDPRIDTPNTTVDDDYELLLEEEGYTRVMVPIPPPEHPLDLVRIFTSPNTAPPDTTTVATAPNVAEQDRDTVEVYTDGSCHDNGTEQAKCGSGVWYGERHERNLAVRIGPPLPLTNNTGELVAVLRAIQENKTASRLLISSD
ncbi:hypothetical protein DFP72DRAFT_752816, partial [Ephemerocybe angulata]